MVIMSFCVRKHYFNGDYYGTAVNKLTVQKRHPQKVLVYSRCHDNQHDNKQNATLSIMAVSIC
jgi:hypothetical protein